MSLGCHSSYIIAHSGFVLLITYKMIQWPLQGIVFNNSLSGVPTKMTTVKLVVKHDFKWCTTSLLCCFFWTVCMPKVHIYSSVTYKLMSPISVWTGQFKSIFTTLYSNFVIQINKIKNSKNLPFELYGYGLTVRLILFELIYWHVHLDL